VQWTTTRRSSGGDLETNFICYPCCQFCFIIYQERNCQWGLSELVH